MRADGGHSYEVNQNASLVRVMPEDPDNIMMLLPVFRDDTQSARARTGSEDGYSIAVGLFRHNLQNENQRRIVVGEADTASILVDQNYEPILRYDFDDERRRIAVYIRDGSWRPVFREDYQEERFGRGGRGRRIFTPAGMPAGWSVMAQHIGRPVLMRVGTGPTLISSIHLQANRRPSISIPVARTLAVT